MTDISDRDAPTDGEDAAEPVNLAERREQGEKQAALKLAHSVAGGLQGNGAAIGALGNPPMVAVSPMTPTQAIEYQQRALRAQNELHMRQHFATLLIDKAGMKDAGEVIQRAEALVNWVLGPKPPEGPADVGGTGG